MNKKKLGIITSAMVMLAGVSGFLIWDNSYNFTTGAKGRSLSSDGYFADFEKFNGTDSFALQLEKGEKLDFEGYIDKGWAEIDVLEGDKSVFKLSGFDNASTDYTIPEDGEYTLKVRAKHAKGEINISFDENRKDKTVYSSDNVN